jgi:membrane protease YdiL (CAAX protease family)
VANASSIALGSKSSRARPRVRRAKAQPYRPYHLRGELILLTLVALSGFLWLALPVPFLIKLIGAVTLFLFVPAALLREYWPKIQLHDLGWRMPNHPRNPVWYTAIVTLIAFSPITLFLIVENPATLVAVSPSAEWVPWIITQGLVAILAMSQSAFFTGIILFRLTHLMKPVMAIVWVAVIMTLGQLLLPGTLAIFALPLSLAFSWMAWQTHSFVPVAVMQILLSVTYDLLVRMSV